MPPPVMPVAVMRQLPKQPLQDLWKKGPLAAVTKHVFLWVACLGEEVSPGTTSPGDWRRPRILNSVLCTGSEILCY